MQEISLLFYKKLVTSIQKKKYAVKIRFIIYTIVKTYIDIVFTTSIISYFTKNSKLDYFSDIDQILKYLAGSQDKKIIFGNKSELWLVGYLDSN